MPRSVPTGPGPDPIGETPVRCPAPRHVVGDRYLPTRRSDFRTWGRLGASNCSEQVEATRSRGRRQPARLLGGGHRSCTTLGERFGPRRHRPQTPSGLRSTPPIRDGGLRWRRTGSRGALGMPWGASWGIEFWWPMRGRCRRAGRRGSTPWMAPPCGSASADVGCSKEAVDRSGSRGGNPQTRVFSRALVEARRSDTRWSSRTARARQWAGRPCTP